jgi:hypothetical protein
MKTRPILFAAMVFVATAHADVIFTVTPSVQYGVKNKEVVFTGTLSNTNLTGDLFLNDIQISFASAATNYLTASANTFFASVPGILSPGETYSDVVFAVAISSNTPAGDYFGTVTIVGGTNIFDATALASQPFQITSSDTPFGAWQLLEFGTNATNPAISGELADPDGDGIVNLLEYALNLDPNVASVAGLPAPQIDSSCGCLTLTYTKILTATDLIYIPEAAEQPGGSWSTNGVTETIMDADTVAQTIKASDTGHPVATTTNRFMHLKITRLP